MIVNQLFYLVFKISSFSICSLAWCGYCHTSTLHLGFYPILWDPYRRSYRPLPLQRPRWTACSKPRPRKLRSDRSIIRTVRAYEYDTNIRTRAWRVHLRAPPTTSWWATRAVGETRNFCANTNHEHWAKFLSSENFVLYSIHRCHGHSATFCWFNYHRRVQAYQHMHV